MSNMSQTNTMTSDPKQLFSASDFDPSSQILSQKTTVDDPLSLAQASSENTQMGSG